MTDPKWQATLLKALSTNDTDTMKEALAKIPPMHLHTTLQMFKDQGHAHYCESRYEEALQAYNSVISMNAADYHVLLHRAESLFMLDRTDDALEAAKYCASQFPDKEKVFRLLGRICLKLKDKASALEVFRRALELKPNDMKLAGQIAELEKETRQEKELLDRVLNPDKQPEQDETVEAPELPTLSYDPTKYQEPTATTDEGMTRALVTFLKNFAGQEEPRHLISRLEDRAWLEPWLALARRQKDRKLVVWGPEMGLIPLAAVEAGASKATIWDDHLLTRRLAQGIIQKNVVAALDKRFGEQWPTMPNEKRQALFEEALAAYEFLDTAPGEGETEKAENDTLIITQFDHGLLGKGLVRAVNSCKEHLLSKQACIFPGKATIYAQGVSWNYQVDGFDFSCLDDYHWSPYPIQLATDHRGYRPLTQAVAVSEIDFANFETQQVEVTLPIEETGLLTGIMYWFELDLDGEKLSNAPGGSLQSLGMAYQYVDNLELTGDALTLDLSIEEDRLHFQTRPPISAERASAVPHWHIDSLWRGPFEARFAERLKAAIAKHQPKRILNICAGNGYNALTAAAAGCEVIAVELDPNMCRALEANAALNGLAQKITVHQMDPRKLTLEQVGEKVDMVLFDSFDVGLLGEGIVHYLAHVLGELTKEDAILFPQSASIKGMLIQRRFENIAGYGASILTPYLFTPEYTSVELAKTEHIALSKPFDLFSFDFARAEVKEEEQELKVTIDADGILSAVVFWYELKLDEETSISTAPHQAEHRRRQALQYLPEIYVRAGQELEMKAKHTSSNLAFAVKPDGLKEEDILKLPRFDPNWLNLHRNVMHQNGQIMQQLHAHTSEYEKAYDLALRMALRPGQHGITAAIAQRFYHSLLH